MLIVARAGQCERRHGNASAGSIRSGVFVPSEDSISQEVLGSDPPKHHKIQMQLGETFFNRQRSAGSSRWCWSARAPLRAYKSKSYFVHRAFRFFGIERR